MKSKILFLLALCTLSLSAQTVIPIGDISPALGTAATKNVGTGSTDVAAGDAPAAAQAAAIAAAAADATAKANAAQAAAIQRANHTGNQLAATISDFSTAVAALITGKANLSGGNSWLGVQVFPDATVVTPATIPALAIDVTKADNRKSISSPSTFTLSNNTPTNGQVFGFKPTNTSGSVVLVTLPSVTVYSLNHGAVITTFWLGAGNTEDTFWEYDSANSRFIVAGIPTPGYGPEFAQTAAATTDLWQTSLNQTVTGTTAITSFGTNAPAGTRVHLRFLAATPLTYNATSMIIPGSASYTAAVGDTAEALALGSGNWQITRYTKRDGTPLVGGGGSGVADPGGAGIMVRTTANVSVPRTLVDTSATYTTTTNGNGQSGNPSIGLTPRVTTAVDSVTFLLTIDALADSMNYTIGYLPAAFTITEMRFVHNGTLTSPSIVPTIKHGTSRASGTSVVTSPAAVTNSTTGASVTTFNSATTAANAWLWIETASKSGTTDKFTVAITGHY